jgi:hypothetical protein
MKTLITSHTRISSFLVFILFWIALNNFPHLFTFRHGVILSGICIIAYFTALLLTKCRPSGMLSKQVIEAWFPLFLSIVISCLGMGALNDALFASDTGRLTIYNGFMTIGGLMPTSDAAQYLSGMQTFIHFGELSNWSLFKPVSILWAAVLYDLLGEDMVRFLRVSVLCYTTAAVYLGVVSRRHFGSLFSVLLTLGVSFYFVYYHGTFLTENFSAPFALLSMALLLDGWQSRKLRIFLAGIGLLSLAMVMRPGAIIFVPILILASGFRFAHKRHFSWTIPVKTAIVYAVVVGLSFVQPLLLKHPFRHVSNAAAQLYQIHTDAPSWTVYQTIPFSDSLRSLEEVAAAKTEFVNNAIKKDPLRFGKNYILAIIRAIPRPETWVFSFAYQLPGWFRWGFLFLFFITPWVRGRNDPVQGLFLMLCLNLIGSLLSIPVMEEVRTRLMMVTIPLHIMVAVLGLCNAIYILSKMLEFTSLPSGNFFTTASLPHLTPLRTTIWSALLIIIVFFAPILHDKLRKTEQPAIPDHVIKNMKNQLCILIDLRTTPRALFDLSRQFRVVDPYIIPRSKFLSNMSDTSQKMKGRFYLSNAISCVGNSKYRQHRSLLLIPDSLIPAQKAGSPRYMLFSIHRETIRENLKPLHIADAVLWAQ